MITDPNTTRKSVSPVKRVIARAYWDAVALELERYENRCVFAATLSLGHDEADRFWELADETKESLERLLIANRHLLGDEAHWQDTYHFLDGRAAGEGER